MPSNVALLEYFTSPEHTLIFLVKKGFSKPMVFELSQQPEDRPLRRDDLLQCAERLMLDFHGLPPGWDAPEQIEHYRQLLALPPAVNAAKRSKEILQLNLKKPAFAYQLTYWESLSEAFFPQALRQQLEDVELLCFIPHGPLHSLPLAALRWSTEQYLIERFGVCYAHSAGVLRYCQAKNRMRTAQGSHQPSSALIAAVAAADDQDPQEFEADGDTLAGLFNQRPGEHQVTAMIGARQQDRRLPASKDLIRQMIGGYDVVHLACHGLFQPESLGNDPLDSGLLVSDGETVRPLAEVSRMSPAQRASHFLSAREVLSLELNADLVTLRACSSGRAEIRSGDELIGLTRAFLYAGAPSLIVSLWNVNKASSRSLLDRFYRLWLDGPQALPKWQALQQAQISLLRDPDPAYQYAHPYHWAPFVLVGDWL